METYLLNKQILQLSFSIAKISFILFELTIGIAARGQATVSKKGIKNEPAITYKILQLGKTDPVWKVSINGKGFLEMKDSIHLKLSNWGEWQDVDNYYLRNFVAKPGVLRKSDRLGEFVLDPPTNWDGKFEVTYTIPIVNVGSAVHKRFGLLPCWNEYATCGFSLNTLMHVDAGDRSVLRTVHIVPPDGLYVASGWGGITMGEQKTQIVGLKNEMDNTPILIGNLTSQWKEKHSGVIYEAAQFGEGYDLTIDALQVAKAVVPLYEQHCGYSPGQPVRLFFFEGTQGATNTRSAIISSYNRDSKSFIPSFKHLISHEIFHSWLGSDFLLANDSIAWFHEGFTDYIALWASVAGGVLDYDYFSSRISAIDAEARRSPAYGKVAFAQEGVSWRSDANERLAYRGGAVLAFLIDVELRKQGRPGLMQMIADLGSKDQAESITLKNIRRWMEQNGLKSIYKTHLEDKTLPQIGEVLFAIGFLPREDSVELTYFGIQEENNRIVELDPEGPAAKSGFYINDQIIGRYPGWRSERVRISEQVTTKYRYGLEIIEPGVEGTFFDVRRGSEQLTLRIQPILISGGLASRYEADAAKLKEFFAFRLIKVN